MEVTRLLVASYFDIVRANLQDLVPKAVMHFLVNTVQRGLQQHLIRTIYRWAAAGASCCCCITGVYVLATTMQATVIHAQRLPPTRMFDATPASPVLRRPTVSCLPSVKTWQCGGSSVRQQWLRCGLQWRRWMGSQQTWWALGGRPRPPPMRGDDHF